MRDGEQKVKRGNKQPWSTAGRGRRTHDFRGKGGLGNDTINREWMGQYLFENV